MIGMHDGVKYKVLEPGPAGKYGLWVWWNPTKEFIFERSIGSEEDATNAIDQLLTDGFILRSI